MDAVASVIVRAKDKVSTIEDTLSSLRRQTRPVEIVVVDSGSTDGTVEIARRYADKLVQIPAGEFTYGGALNLGAEAASCDIHMALSAHCVPTFHDWVERSVAHYARRDDVAGTNSASETASGDVIEDVYYQVPEDVLVNPQWGFSNHASSWRASVWAEMPFREDLAACEDKEWSWRVLGAGLALAFDPMLQVPSGHRRHEGPRGLWRRHYKECRELARLGALPRPRYRALAEDWWAIARPPTARYPNVIRRFNPWRLAELHGDFAGARTRERISSPRTDLVRICQ